MLRECHRLIYSVVSGAAPGVPVVWAPFQGPLTGYPWIALQQIDGPNGIRIDWRMGQPISGTITVLAGAPGDQVGVRISQQVFEVTHDGSAATTGDALRTLIAERRPAWTVGGAGDTITIADPSRLIFSIEPFWSTSAVTANDGEELRYTSMERLLRVQASIYSTETKQWETNASGTLAIAIRDALHAWDPAPHRVYIRPGAVQQSLVFPGVQADPVIGAVVEMSAWYTEATNPQTELLETVSGTIGGVPFVTDPP